MRERRGRARENNKALHWYQRQHSVYKLTGISLHTNEIHECATKESDFSEGAGGRGEVEREKHNGCTVHF